MSNSPQRMQVDVGALECPVRIDDEMIGEWTLIVHVGLLPGSCS